MHLVYETEIIGDENKKEFYSADESLITHHNNKQIYVLGVINNTTSLEYYVLLIGTFGNQIVTDSWGGYN